MKKPSRKSSLSSYNNLPIKQQNLVLRDMARTIEYGQLSLDKRVQIKIPSLVLARLDTLFPKLDRSSAITKLVIQAILERERFNDKDDSLYFQQSQQQDLDDLWNYLEARENN